MSFTLPLFIQPKSHPLPASFSLSALYFLFPHTLPPSLPTFPQFFIPCTPLFMHSSTIPPPSHQRPFHAENKMQTGAKIKHDLPKQSCRTFGLQSITRDRNSLEEKRKKKRLIDVGESVILTYLYNFFFPSLPFPQS